MTDAPTTYEITWEHTRSIAQKADALGMEAMVPVARWKGFGGNVNFNGTNFETTDFPVAGESDPIPIDP